MWGLIHNPTLISLHIAPKPQFVFGWGFGLRCQMTLKVGYQKWWYILSDKKHPNYLQICQSKTLFTDAWYFFFSIYCLPRFCKILKITTILSFTNLDWKFLLIFMQWKWPEQDSCMPNFCSSFLCVDKSQNFIQRGECWAKKHKAGASSSGVPVQYWVSICAILT